MSDYKEKIAKAKELNASKANTFTFKDENTKQVADNLVEVKKTLEGLQNAFEKGVEHFDNTTTNDLLEEALDKVVELHKAGGENVKELANSIVKQIADIRIDVNVPKQEQKIENKIVVEDWRKAYMFSDSDKTESTKYVGFVSPSGEWYIERITSSETSDKARFIFGKDDYVSNWGKRLQLDYKYLFEAYNGRT